MGPLDALWHLLNFLAPALAVAALSAALAKALWRRDLAGVAWHRLAAWGALSGAAALMGGLVAFGKDGKMATYAALVVATALVQWWIAFGRR
jgi:hypothetical protein